MKDKNKAGLLRIRTWDTALKSLGIESKGENDNEIQEVAQDYYKCNSNTVASGNLG